MKRYDKSEIMNRAWVLVKTTKAGISECLKEAWREAKAAVEEAERRTA